VLVIGLAAIFGFFVRCVFVLRGYSGFNSDEALYYQCFRNLFGNGDPSDYLCNWKPVPGPRFWIFRGVFALFGKKTDAFPFFACLTNVLLYLGCIYAFVRRTSNYWSALPLALFMAVPPLFLAYSGTPLQEIRPSYFYGLTLMAYSGKWSSKPIWNFSFALLASWGCWEDIFTIFFLIPVFLFEWDNWLASPWKSTFRKAAFAGLGMAWLIWADWSQCQWIVLSHKGYFHAGLGNLASCIQHLKILIFGWPVYWFGGMPWGYFQNSMLGRLLAPVSGIWTERVSPFIFWSLFIAGLVGMAKYFREKNQWKEAWVWWGPPFLMLAVFVFGSQVWDSLSLRYLGFLQVLPGFSISFWIASLGKNERKLGPVAVLAVWILLQGGLFIWDYGVVKRENPAYRIIARMEQMDCKTGYANYWVSEPVRYFSNEEILLTPYDQAPYSRRAGIAAQTSKKIALVWLEGLDHPDVFDEVVRQIQSLHYHAAFKQSFPEEGWSVFIWEKNIPR
jgi:hypothetical protein